MLRNIKIAYLNAFFRHSWFWLGIWVFYYLSITDYAGIGLIETCLIVSMTVMEIPTGAIADLLGRKNTLIVGYSLQVGCQILMALSTNLPMLLISVVLGGIGGALCSGTDEALVYDSLKEAGQENTFVKVQTNVNSISLVGVSISGAIGGWLYLQNPTLPFWFSGAGYLLALLFSLALYEPKIDSVKFSWKNYINQNKVGFKALLQTPTTRRLVMIVVMICGALVIFDESLDSILAVEFGFQPVSISIFFAIACLLTAVASQLSPTVKRIFPGTKGITFLTIIVVVTALISPFVGIAIGSFSIILRMISYVMIENVSTALLNPLVDSKYRATTISTLNMLTNLPYVFSAFFLGMLMDIITARNFAIILGIILLVFVGYSMFSKKTADTGYA